MRSACVALLLLALAACGQAPATEIGADGAPLLAGRFNAASNTARAITGDVRIERGGLLFSSGVVLFTRTLTPRRGEDVISQSGDSFAAAALAPSGLMVELRRVTEQAVPAGGVGLCGGADVEYVALVHNARAASVTLLVFSGVEAPSPAAQNSQVCATFAFTAPEGARTREGVVL